MSAGVFECSDAYMLWNLNYQVLPEKYDIEYIENLIEKISRLQLIYCREKKPVGYILGKI